MVEQKLGHIPQHRRGAFVVAGVARLVQRLGALLPRGFGHLFGCRPAPIGERSGGLDGDLRADPGAEQQSGVKEHEEGRRRVLFDRDAQLPGEGVYVSLEQRYRDLLLGRFRHASLPPPPTYSASIKRGANSSGNCRRTFSMSPSPMTSRRTPMTARACASASSYLTPSLSSTRWRKSSYEEIVSPIGD